MAKPIQQRLSERESEFRDRLIINCWMNFRDELTMQEMANVFRMPLSQFFRIVKTKFSKAKIKKKVSIRIPVKEIKIT